MVVGEGIELDEDIVYYFGHVDYLIIRPGIRSIYVPGGKMTIPEYPESCNYIRGSELEQAIEH